MAYETIVFGYEGPGSGPAWRVVEPDGFDVRRDDPRMVDAMDDEGFYYRQAVLRRAEAIEVIDAFEPDPGIRENHLQSHEDIAARIRALPAESGFVVVRSEEWESGLGS